MVGAMLTFKPPAAATQGEAILSGMGNMGSLSTGTSHLVEAISDIFWVLLRHGYYLSCRAGAASGEDVVGRDH